MELYPTGLHNENAGTPASAAAARLSVLRATFSKRNGMTVIDRKYHTAPIKIAKAFPLDRQLGVIVMDVSPGLLDGDRYEFDWSLKRESHAMLTNQSFTKVHPCLPLGGSSMRQKFDLEEDAVAEHMPEPVMLYKKASFHNETIVRLKAGAVWMQAEVLCPGRTLRGERFDYRSFSSELSVQYGDELIFFQRQRIEPAGQAVGAPGCWEEMTHWGTFYLFSDRAGAALLEQLQARIDSFVSPAGHPIIAGATLTYRYGVVVSAGSTAAWPLQQLMRELWGTARAGVLELPPIDWPR